MGFHLARIFSKENHQVVMIEPDADKIKRAQELLDSMGIEGSGASVQSLAKAGLNEAELLIAVSSAFEVNIIACMLADKFGVPRKIARVRSQEYT